MCVLFLLRFLGNSKVGIQPFFFEISEFRVFVSRALSLFDANELGAKRPREEREEDGKKMARQGGCKALGVQERDGRVLYLESWRCNKLFKEKEQKTKKNE